MGKEKYNRVAMKHLWFLTIAAYILGALAAETIKAEEQTNIPQQGIKLAYSFSPGKINRYKIVQKITGTRTITDSATTDLDMQLTSIIRMRCTKTLENGKVEIAIDTEDEYMKISGKAIYGYKPSKDVRTIQLNPNGRISSSSTSNQKEPKRRHALDFGAVESILLLAILPDKPVAPGDVWSAEMPLPIDTKSKLKLDFQLEEIKTSPGGQVAIIKQKLTTPINEANESQEEGTRGSQAGESTLTFDISNGTLISANGSIHTKIETPISVPPVPGSTPSRSVQIVDVTSNYTIELLPEQNKAQ